MLTLALASLSLPPPRQQPLDAVSIRAAEPAAASRRRGIVCVSVPPYDNAEQDEWCEANNNEGTLCGPEAWSPPGAVGCLSKTCRCANAEDVLTNAAPGAATLVCKEDERYVVKEASPSEGWLTDDWCASYCDVDGGCPEEAVEKCKCGPDVPEVAEVTAVPGAVPLPGEADADEDLLICANDQYVAANAASSDLWCAGSCVPDGCPKDAQEACKCDEPHNGEGPITEGDMAEVDYSCLSINVDKTNEWCNSECGEYGECPSSAKQYCKCGDDAVTDKVLDQAQKATIARDTAANVRRATSSAKSACLARNRVGEDCEQL